VGVSRHADAETVSLLRGGTGGPCSASPHPSNRSRSLITVAAYHLPPVALAILRRFSSAAALCADKPASWAITGRIRSARAAASLALRSDPAVQPPSFAPRRLAAARPALVRCEMSARSFCASAANRRRTKGSTSAPSSVTTNGRNLVRKGYASVSWP